MRPFNTTELAGMESIQLDTMQDRCMVLVYSEVVDAYGGVRQVYTATGTEIRCGVEIAGQDSSVELLGSAETARTIIDIRLPLDTELTPRDRIRVTKRFGRTLTTPLDYEVVGPLHAGPSAMVAKMRTADENE